MGLDSASATRLHARIHTVLADMFPATLVRDGVELACARINRGVGNELIIGGKVVRIDYVVRIDRTLLGGRIPAQGDRLQIDGLSVRVARVTDRTEENAVHLELTQAGK